MGFFSLFVYCMLAWIFLFTLPAKRVNVKYECCYYCYNLYVMLQYIGFSYIFMTEMIFTNKLSLQPDPCIISYQWYPFNGIQLHKTCPF